ncbi:hypothetical protein CMV_010266 [Castanea mollissima]|uniref:Uncharacterized protein n=1 Tax=Castanea mollissima TaxID=60419 RepID=A0A8J4W0V6_9ROSI|nr:hypothetical protein CMV_010266 [Castanea mollissima]
MDKYLVPLNPSPEKPNPIRRRRWKRTAIELNGRFEPKYRHEISGLLMQSYSEMNRIGNGSSFVGQMPIGRQGISALEFDNKVACTSMKRNEVLIFDIGYVSSEPVEVLRTRQAVTVHGSDSHKGLSDIAFTSVDDSRLLASDTSGVISVWDRRMSILPCLELTTNSHSTVNSIELNVENQVIFGAGKHGVIYMWDIRGGRGSAAFQSHKEIYAVGSSSDKGIHLLDFYPDPSSASHVEHSENIESSSGIKHQKKQNRFVPLSEGVTACAAHPLNGTIIAGTKHSSLLVISQKPQSF